MTDSIVAEEEALTEENFSRVYGSQEDWHYPCSYPNCDGHDDREAVSWSDLTHRVAVVKSRYGISERYIRDGKVGYFLEINIADEFTRDTALTAIAALRRAVDELKAFVR